MRPCWTSRLNQAEMLMAFSLLRSLSIPRRIWGSLGSEARWRCTGSDHPPASGRQRTRPTTESGTLTVSAVNEAVDLSVCYP